MELKNWKSEIKRTGEDKLLLEYSQLVHGTIFAEVVTGKGGIISADYGADARPRRIDAVRIIQSAVDTIITWKLKRNGQEFKTMVEKQDIEIIEIKRWLDRYVFGQVIAGEDLLNMEYQPISIQKVILCQKTDPVMREVCRRQHIKVWTPEGYLVTKEMFGET